MMLATPWAVAVLYDTVLTFVSVVLCDAGITRVESTSSSAALPAALLVSVLFVSAAFVAALFVAAAIVTGAAAAGRV